MNSPPIDKKIEGRPNSLGRHISILYRYWQIYMDRALAPLGIGSGQVPILTYLFLHDGVNQNEIVHHLRTDKSSTARTIRKLVDRGYVQRLSSPDDGRAYEIRITDAARAMCSDLKSVLIGWTEALSQDLSADERILLFDMLDRMQARAEELVNPGQTAGKNNRDIDV